MDKQNNAQAPLDPVVSKLRLALLITWKEEGEWYFFRTLGRRTARLETVQPFFLNRPVSSRLRRLSIRLAPLYTPLAALLRRERFDAVVSWSIPFTATYGILTRFLRLFTTPPKHIARDFHVDMSRRDLVYRLKLALLKCAAPGVDFCLCTSGREEDIYSAMFGFPRDRIRFFPDEPTANFMREFDHPVKNYVFAYGNSDRDFDTVLAAARGLPLDVVILSQAYAPTGDVPANVTIISERVPEEKLIELGASAKIVVLPLKSRDVAAGQNTMLEVMSLGRPLIATENLASLEYGREGETCLFCRPNDAEDLRGKIRRLLDNPEQADAMGRAGKTSAAKRQYDGPVLFENVLREVFDGKGVRNGGTDAS